ncbi:MAG: DUF4265 domain-containing protein [Planctomycetia bacterium]|nr:DUF4265 domain-containing protein [Planctomycetia bacterium]
MTVRFGREEPLIEFPAERLTVSVPVTAMNSRLYRLDGVPIFVESASFGDVIEAEPVGVDRLRFVRIAEPGGWRTFDYVLSPQKIDGEWGQYLLAELTERGGYWERVFGGLLFVCVPPGFELDPAPWVATF